MAFMDKVTTLAGKAVDKGNDVVEITKLKTKISGAEKDITALKCDIADYIMTKMENGAQPDENVVELVNQIKAKMEEIEGYDAQIAEIKG